MKRAHCWILSSLLMAMLVPVFTAGLAHAYPEFKKEFDKKYAPLAPQIAKVKCNVCHVGKSKKDRNEYGKALSKFITKKEKKKPDKIQEALQKAEGEHSDPANASSPTFGELMKEGKLPVETAH